MAVSRIDSGSSHPPHQFNSSSTRVDQLSDWLLETGRRSKSVAELVQSFGTVAVSLGLPLWRLSTNIRVLHPLKIATTLEWFRDSERVEQTEWPHESDVVIATMDSPLVHTFLTGESWRWRFDHRTPQYSLLKTLRDRGATDYVAFTLGFSDGPLNAISWTTDQRNGFSEDEVSECAELSRLLGVVAEVLALREVRLALLKTYLGPGPTKKVMRRGRIRRGAFQPITAVIWYSDLRGFTELSETLDADATIELLNAYFDCMAGGLAHQRGEILKFIGDGLLAMFPVEDHGSEELACKAALSAALEAQERMNILNLHRIPRGQPPLRFGLGLHLGDVMYGNVGAADRLDFTVIGPAVNLTSRLEKLTGEIGVWLLTSEDFARHLPEVLDDRGLYQLRGITKRHRVFTTDRFKVRGLNS